MNYIKFTALKAFTSEFKLRTNPVKAFNGTCMWLTSITFPVIWSNMLISVTREWRYRGLVYKFFLINIIELKCSIFQCRKYHKSWSNGAAELHIYVDLLCGTTAAELRNSVYLLCGTTAAELHNSVNLLCGTTAATKPGLMHAPGVADIFQRQWRTMLNFSLNDSIWSSTRSEMNGNTCNFSE